jgi:hypothetical protein
MRHDLVMLLSFIDMWGHIHALRLTRKCICNRGVYGGAMKPRVAITLFRLGGLLHKKVSVLVFFVLDLGAGKYYNIYKEVTS